MTNAIIKAVAWDIDGTLIDSEPVHHLALMDVSERYGLPIAADDARFIGVAMEDVWRVLSSNYPADLTCETWLGEIVDAYIERASELTAIPGACETVHALGQRGIAQCCVSNSVRRIVEANLAAVGLADVVSFAVAREDVEHGKPDPASYALAVRKLGLHPAQVLAVEDSPVGARAARVAGLDVLQFGQDFDDFNAVTDLILNRRLSA